MRVISGTAPVPICPLHRCGATSPGTGPHRTAAGCELVKTWSRAATNLLMVPPSTLCIFFKIHYKNRTANLPTAPSALVSVMKQVPPQPALTEDHAHKFAITMQKHISDGISLPSSPTLHHHPL